MLGRLRAELQTELRSRGVPVVVEYGPVTPSRLGEMGDAVVVEYDPAGDAVGAPKAIGGIPRRRFTHTQRCLATVHGKATVPGARRQDHEARALKLAQQVLICLDNKLRGEGYVWRSTGGRFAMFAEAGQQPAGATYEIRFEVDAAVFDREWSDEDPPTVTIGGDGGVGISSTTRASLVATVGDGDVACGAEDP